MKHLIFIFTVLISVLSQAETKLQELVIESRFEEEHGHYRLWVQDDKFFVEHFGNSDRSPAETKKVEISKDQAEFIQTRLDEIRNLKNSPDCVSREITATYQMDGKVHTLKGCTDSNDRMSTQLNQLSSILMILI